MSVRPFCFIIALFNLCKVSIASSEALIYVNCHNHPGMYSIVTEGIVLPERD